MAYRSRLARLGEWQAALFLERRGATIVNRNLRVGRGEIDLVARWEDGTRAAVEVKTRRHGNPVEAFDVDKARRVREAAARLRPAVARIDLCAVSVRPDGIEIHWIPRIG